MLCVEKTQPKISFKHPGTKAFSNILHSICTWTVQQFTYPPPVSIVTILQVPMLLTAELSGPPMARCSCGGGGGGGGHTHTKITERYAMAAAMPREMPNLPPTSPTLPLTHSGAHAQPNNKSLVSVKRQKVHVSFPDPKCTGARSGSRLLVGSSVNQMWIKW